MNASYLAILHIRKLIGEVTEYEYFILNKLKKKTHIKTRIQWKSQMQARVVF